MMRVRTIQGVVAMAALAVSLVACGGGGSGGTVADTTTPVISKGVMTKGSTIVNGVRFEDTTANITADDQVKTAAFLDDGMVVKVKGKRNDDGVTGTAQEIEVENEVRGTVTSVGTGTFEVLGQTVVVTSATVTAGGWSFDPATLVISGLTGTVEVHGERNVAGDIVASRVEMQGGGAEDELRGVVTGLTPTPFVAGTSTFNIGGLAIATTVSTVVSPTGAVVQEGTLVEVHLTGGNSATHIEVEDAEDAEFEPAEGQEVEFEGFVSNYDGTDFDLDAIHVHTTGSTRYESGVYADLADDAKVEVEGHMSAGVLQADKIKFNDTVRMEANIEIGTFTLLLGRMVYTTAATEILNGPIADGNGVRLRGFLNSDGISVTATRLEKLSNPVASDKSILQGPVSAKDEGTKTITIMGMTVDVSSVPAHEVKNDNDDMITLGQFYAAITLDRTAVKVRGTYSVGTLTADKAELE